MKGCLNISLSFDNGKVIFKNDKGERKATGAYYTPDYIVKYIVEKERKDRVEEAIRLYQSEIEHIAINTDKWQNKNRVKEDDKGRDKEGSAEARKMAGKPRRYKILAEGISGQGSRLGDKVHGVREGAGKYEQSEGTYGEGEDSTRPLVSTDYSNRKNMRYFILCS
jgi:hypothetical protein